MRCSNSNRADDVLGAFASACETYGVTSRVRCDHGGENVLVGVLMNLLRGLRRGSFITGRSVHNQSVALEKDTRLQTESALWRQLRQSRITASKVGQVCIRHSAHDKLCDQLRRKFRATAAMKEGSLREPEAAVAYANILMTMSIFTLVVWSSARIHTGLQQAQIARCTVQHGNRCLACWR